MGVGGVMSRARYDYRRKRPGFREEEMSDGSFDDASIDSFVVADEDDVSEGESEGESESDEVARPGDEKGGRSPALATGGEGEGAAGPSGAGVSGGGGRRRRSSAAFVVLSSSEGEGEEAAQGGGRRRRGGGGTSLVPSPSPSPPASPSSSPKVRLGGISADEPERHAVTSGKRARRREAQQTQARKMRPHSQRVLLSDSSSRGSPPAGEDSDGRKEDSDGRKEDSDGRKEGWAELRAMPSGPPGLEDEEQEQGVISVWRRSGAREDRPARAPLRDAL